MQTKYGFTLMTIEEFEKWIQTVRVNRYINILQVHHTYSPSYKEFTGSNEFALQQGMKNYHVNSCGYADIAQHFSVYPNGNIVTGRSLDRAAACCVGANTNGIGVEIVGNFDRGGDTMVQKQKDTIVRMYAAMAKRFNINIETGIRYHCEYTASGTYLGTYIPGRSCKTCPGTNFFGGNTRASYDKNLKPLIKQAMNGTYEGMDDEVITNVNIFNCADKKTYTMPGILKNGENYIRLRSIADAFDCLVGYDANKKLPSFDTMPVKAAKLVVNGEAKDVESLYRQSDENFIKIRDILTGVFGIPGEDILWDDDTRTITVAGKVDMKYTSATELADSENK